MATDPGLAEWQGCVRALRDVKASGEYAFQKSAFYLTGKLRRSQAESCTEEDQQNKGAANTFSSVIGLVDLDE